MTEPIYLRENETKNVLGGRMVLYYFITEDEVFKEEFGKMTYGIGVEMYIQQSDGKAIKERKVIDSVFSDKRNAEKFLDILCDGCVTPVSLNDVIYDYLSDEAIS